MHIKSLALCLLALSCGSPPGQKMLRLEITQNETPILITAFDVPDKSSTSEIIEAAGRPPLFTNLVSNLIAITQLVENPLETKVEGKINLTIQHLENIEINVILEGIKLIRSAPDLNDWHLPSAEIKRIHALVNTT